MLGDWGKNLTKTPILVLFIVLISMGVGTASALITITLAGDVHVLGEMKIDETLLIGTDNPNDDDGIRFDDGSEVIFWDESEDSFMVTDDLVIEGDLKTVGDLRVGTDNGADDDKIFFDSGLENLSWDESEGIFFLSDSLLLNEDLYVSGVFSIDDDSIYFDIGTDEFLTWDNSETQFEFSDAIVTGGVIQAGNAGADVAYNRIGTGLQDSNVIVNSDDLFVTRNMEIDGDLYAEGNIFVGTDIGGDDDFILFDDGGEFLFWDDSETQFEFSDPIVTGGVIQAGNDGADVGYNRIGTGTTSNFIEIASNQDLYITDDLEVGDDISGSKAIFESLTVGPEPLNVFGKATFSGGVDPPYVSFSGETHDSIKQFARDVSDYEEVMQFWNTDNHQFEIYVIAEDSFYTFFGEKVKYKSTGIPENSAINRLAEFEEQKRIRNANPQVEEPKTEE